MSRSAQPRAEGGADHALPRVSGPGLIRRSREASSARARPVARVSARAYPAHCEGAFPRETHVRLSTRVSPNTLVWGRNKAHFFSSSSVLFLESLRRSRRTPNFHEIRHPFRTTAPPLSIVRGAMVATLACAPVTFTASAPRERAVESLRPGRAPRGLGPARSIEARATAEATFPEPRSRSRRARRDAASTSSTRTRTRWCTTPTTSSSSPEAAKRLCSGRAAGKSSPR